MRVLVTGGAGFIGTNLIHRLCEKGHCVLNVDKLTYAGNLLSHSSIDKKAYHHVGHDICDHRLMEEDFQNFEPDWVIHLAAESHVDRSIDSADSFVETNIVGTYNLLKVARDYFSRLDRSQRGTFRFLHVSTDEVFGSLPATGRFTETSPYDPHSPYSASKAASDHLARAWSTTHGLPVLVTNCSNNYGPFQFPEKLIPVVIINALKGQQIPVYGTGDNVRDWLHVKDHVEALITVAERGLPGSSYNVGGDNEWRNIDLVRLLCRILDQELPRQDGSSYTDLIGLVPDRPGHDQRYAVDSSKLQRELGWKSTRNGQEGFAETVRWYLERKDWWEPIIAGTHQLNRLGICHDTHGSLAST